MALRIKIKRGDSRDVAVTIKNADGTAKDLTAGGTAIFTLNTAQAPTDDLSAALQKKVTSFPSPTLGIVTFHLTNSDTQNITPGVYFYDAQFTDASGNVSSTDQGKCTVEPDTSRSIS